MIADKTADYLEGMYADALEKGEVQTAVARRIIWDWWRCTGPREKNVT